MRVIQKEARLWQVVEDFEVLAEFSSSESAWKWVDWHSATYAGPDAKNAHTPRETMARIVKVTVTLQPRPDGGLRIYSDDLPGLMLSGADPDLVIGDLLSAIKTLQSNREPIPVFKPPAPTDQEDR